MLKTLLVSLLTLLVTVAQMFAQDARGTLLGQVTDASGSGVPSAQVRIVNTATGVTASAATNESGRYFLPYLAGGTYTVSVEQSGFKKFIREGVQIRIGDSVELNIALEIGNVSESVQVTAETPLLGTTDSSLGQVVDERRVTELPLFAGNAMDLVHLAPGTVNGTDLRLRKAPFNNAPSQFSTDGSGNYQNEFTIDGVSNTYSDGESPRVAFSPPQTAIGEFKVQTSSFDASTGHTLGSVVNVSTKSGTNELHGEAHWWLRNSAFDAPTIFQNRTGSKLPVYQDNRYGFSAGAPVIIPKLYNGKNKTFWFYAFEANKFGDPQNFINTVPTERMRRGDLSELLALGTPDASGRNPYQIYDPLTTTALPNGTFQRQPFPGNIIPQNRLDPVAQRLLSAYPAPNVASSSLLQNHFYTGKALEDYWVQMGRVDHAFSDTHRLFVRMHRDYWEEDKSRSFGNEGVNGIILNRINRGLAIDDVYMFSPTFLMNIRYGITQQEFPERRVTRGTDLATLGFGPTVTQYVDPSTATFPRLNRFDQFTTLSAWESGDGTTSSIVHALNANFTKLTGSHNIRFGPDVRVYREFKNRFNLQASPDFDYNNGGAQYTRGPLNTNGNPTRGGDLAAFLLGIPAGTMSLTSSYAEQDKYLSLYVQDDWKISSKLTLNLGLRWEIESAPTERFDRSVKGFDAATANPIDAAARAAYARNPIPELSVANFRVIGGPTFVGGSNGRGYFNGENGNFMPRVGFAYSMFPKTVIRGGYGLFYNTIGVNLTSALQTGFSQSTPIQASLDNGVTYVATLGNPFPTGLIPAAGASGGLTTNLGQRLDFFQENRLQPYAQRWSMSLQQEVGMGFLMEAAYVGNRGTRLATQQVGVTGTGRNINPIPREYLSTLPSRDQNTINFLNATFPNPFLGLAPVFPQTITRAQLLRPYPQFGDIYFNDPSGYSWYHSLQARMEKRFSKGYTVQASYTWSKSMEAREFLNDTDPLPYEVISDLDRTHALRASGIWEIPVGRGRQWGGNMHRAIDFVVGGWQLNGVYQHQSGQPLGFGNRFFSGNLDDINAPDDQRSVDYWLNRNSGFNIVGTQQPQNNIRTMAPRYSGIRGPGQDRLDLGIIKNFRIAERYAMQFRAESFNALNHPNLGNPATDPTQASFGTITAQGPPRSWQFSLKFTF